MSKEKTLDELRASGVRKVRVVDEDELKESVFKRLLNAIFGEKVPPNVEIMEKLYEETKRTNELLELIAQTRAVMEPPPPRTWTSSGTDCAPPPLTLDNVTITLDDAEVTSTLDDVEIEETKDKGTGSAAAALKKLKEGK